MPGPETPNAKVRGLGTVGVNTDLDTYDAPYQGFSFAKNCRFRNLRIQNAPVWKTVSNTVSNSEPRYIATTYNLSGQDRIFVGYQSGNVTFYDPSTNSETDYSANNWTPSTSDLIWSSGMLADVFYMNRADRAPWFIFASNNSFESLATDDSDANQWPSTYTAAFIRPIGGCLAAFNITKNGTNYPTMVKTSSFALSGDIPTSWDSANPSTDATENILADMGGPIVDASPLGTYMLIFSNYQTYLMTPDATGLIWDYTPLPFDMGAINTNCSIEIDAKVFVVGMNDWWVTDGTTKNSICDQITHDFIFSQMDMTKVSRFFIAHNLEQRELTFHYCSADAYIAFSKDEMTGCNRSVTYNYVNRTFVFDDNPSVHAADRTNLDIVVEWDTIQSTWDTVSGTWFSFQDTQKRVMTYVGSAVSNTGVIPSIYAYDPFGSQGIVNNPVDTNATQFPYLERAGLDLDEIGMNLPATKQVQWLVPQCRIDVSSNATIDFQVGMSDNYNQQPDMSDWQPFDGAKLDFIDVNLSGRFLAYNIRFNDYKTFSISGWDALINDLAARL